MNRSSTSSVSKGCFVFKPSSKKKKVSFTTADYFNKGQDADPENSRIRFETYQGLWHQMKKQTEQLQEDLNKKLFDGLIEFFRQSHSEFQETKNEWSSRMKSSEIPTAALVLGVNVTDHDVTFKSLSDVLQESVTPYVASLHSKECPGIGQMVQKLLVQLMGQNVNVDYDEDDDDQVQVTCRRTHCSMASLSGWYQSVTKKGKASTPSKKRHSSASRYWHSPPVVVIIKDLESFSAKVLQDFIIIISQYIHALPLILVFGIATSPMIIHRLLSHSVCSLLCIELFQSLSCTEHLSTVVDKLLLTTQFPFKLSGKVLQVLISIFLYHDFSVHNFIKGLQLSLVEHFHSQSLSVLCCSLREARRRIQIFSHADCETLRQLPSFMRYVESQVPEKQVQLLTCDSSVKEVTEKLLEDLHVYHENYIPVLRCLHSFTSILPKYPLGKQIRELHCTCLEKNVWEYEEYAAAFQLLRMLAKEELVSALKKGLECLKNSLGKQLGDAAEKMEEFLAKFQSPEGLDSGQVNQATNGEEEDISPQKTLHKTDLYHLQKTLLELKDSRRSRKLSPFEVLRHEVVDFIDSLVRKYLVSPEMQTFYEVMYFSGTTTLRRHLNAAPRIALHTALNNPYSYLKNDALKSDAGSISHSAPDICIAYKLHLECGRLINLYDWLEAFATVVTAAEDQESEPLDKVDEVIHARFIRAVSELELLGFVKATKQKTDHVARLTWGGC